MEEAALKIAHAGQREDVKQQRCEEVIERAENVEMVVSLAYIWVAEVAEVFEHLASHGASEVAANGAGESIGDERAVPFGDMVGNDNHGLTPTDGGGGIKKDF